MNPRTTMPSAVTSVARRGMNVSDAATNTTSLTPIPQLARTYSTSDERRANPFS